MEAHCLPHSPHCQGLGGRLVWQVMQALFLAKLDSLQCAQIQSPGCSTMLGSAFDLGGLAVCALLAADPLRSPPRRGAGVPNDQAEIGTRPAKEGRALEIVPPPNGVFQSPGSHAHQSAG